MKRIILSIYIFLLCSTPALAQQKLFTSLTQLGEVVVESLQSNRAAPLQPYLIHTEPFSPHAPQSFDLKQNLKTIQSEFESHGIYLSQVDFHKAEDLGNGYAQLFFKSQDGYYWLLVPFKNLQEQYALVNKKMVSMYSPLTNILMQPTRHFQTVKMKGKAYRVRKLDPIEIEHAKQIITDCLQSAQKSEWLAIDSIRNYTASFREGLTGENGESYIYLTLMHEKPRFDVEQTNSFKAFINLDREVCISIDTN